MKFYKLIDKKVVECSNALEWGKWFENFDNRAIADDYVGEWHESPCCVSTAFIGIDLNYGFGELHLFETMVFGGKLQDYQQRCSTYEEAIKQHNRVLRLVKDSLSVT